MSAYERGDWLTTDFDFHLPMERIAQVPVEPRDHARLLHVKGDMFTDHQVFDLPDLLYVDDLLVMNDTKVIPARLYGKRGDVRIEIMLHKTDTDQTWLAFARPGKRLRVGDTIIFAPDFTAEIRAKQDDGQQPHSPKIGVAGGKRADVQVCKPMPAVGRPVRIVQGDVGKPFIER